MAKEVLVLQSDKPPPRAAWRRRCLASVERWAEASSYSYRFIGDELFAPISPDLRRACRDVVLPMTDIGRLLWLERLLAEGWERVIWMDADILIFDPSLDIYDECVGREIWISYGLTTGFRAAESVNNCVLSVVKGSQMLPRLLHATLAAAASFNAPPHPRALGPDLFRQVHAKTPLPVARDIAMASPPMMRGLAEGDRAPLAAHHSVWAGPVRAVNLCGSLIDDDGRALQVVDRLLRNPGEISPDAPPPTVEIISFA